METSKQRSWCPNANHTQRAVDHGLSKRGKSSGSSGEGGIAKRVDHIVGRPFLASVLFLVDKSSHNETLPKDEKKKEMLSY